MSRALDVTPAPGRRTARALFAAAVALLLGVSAAPASAAPAQVPCSASAGGHHDCQWRVPGNGTTGGAPVLAANGTRVGFLHKGSNWIVCQKTGRRDKDGAYFNDTWGYTTADNGKKGWVNALWASGGDNDGGFSGTPTCAPSLGSPPASGTTPAPAPAPSPAPTPAPSPAPSPTPSGGPAPVPCRSIGKGRHSCEWRVAGNGHSGGTPVLNGKGARVGFLAQGSNWVLCQRKGRSESFGGAHNDVWGYTTADDGKTGWANAVWAHGGADDGGFSGTPQCAAKFGAPPTSGTTAAPPTPKPPAPAADSCAHTSEGQTVRLDYSLYETRRHIVTPGNVAQAPASKDDQKPAHHGFGSITLKGDTCKGPHGWRVLESVNVQEHAVGLYKDADDHAAVRGSGSSRGWGLGIAAARNGSFDVQYTACRKGSGWAIAKALLTFPIKALPYVGALAQYAFGALAPEDGTTCDDMGTSRVTLAADRHGKLVVRSQDLTFGAIDERYGVDPQAPGNYHEHTKSADPPKIRTLR